MYVLCALKIGKERVRGKTSNAIKLKNKCNSSVKWLNPIFDPSISD